MTRMSRRAMLGALMLAPSACSLLGGGTQTALYTLTAINNLPGRGPKLRIQMLIDRPTASDALDTVRIALRRNQLSFNYFADSAWTDPAPAMIQALLVDSLQQSGRVTAASRDTLAIRGDYELRVELRHFEAQYQGKDSLPIIRVEFGLILVRVADRAIVGTHSVASEARPATNEVPAIVAGFDQALHVAMAETLTWALEVAGSQR